MGNDYYAPLYFTFSLYFLIRHWVSHWSKTVFAVIHCTFNDKEKVLCSVLICSGRSFYPSLSLRFLKEVTSQGAHINCLTVRMWELRRKVLFLVLNCDEYWHVTSIHPFFRLKCIVLSFCSWERLILAIWNLLRWTFTWAYTKRLGKRSKPFGKLTCAIFS